MKPQELFDADPCAPRWIHGSFIGIDEDDGLWVRADAELEDDVPTRLKVLGVPVVFKDIKQYAILNSHRVISLSGDSREGPVWQHVTELRTGSIGPGWIAVV